MSIPDDLNTRIIEEFRASNGRVGGMFEGAPLLLLHTTGAKSGTERVNPLMYQRVNKNIAVFASKGGAPTNPDWYHNLLKDPRAKVEIDGETLELSARVAEGDERERVFEEQKRTFPQFAEYEQKTSRKIPVVILERAG